MAQADGSVVIDTKIDTTGFRQAEVNVKNSFGKMANAASKMIDAVKSVFTVKSNETNGLEEKNESIRISIDNAAESVKSGMQIINDAMSSGVNTDSLDTIQDKIDTISEHLKSLEAQGMRFGYEEYDKTYQELILALRQYNATLSEAVSAERDTAQAGQQAAQEVGLFQSVLMALSGAAHAPISILQALGNAIRKLPRATVNLVVSGFRKIAEFAGQAAKYVGGKLLSGMKKLGASMLRLNKSTKGVGNGLKNMLKYTLGISGLLVLFRKINSAVKEGMQNLAQYSSETNTHLSALKSSMTQLKNSLATAFAPILTVIEPILTRFINLLSQAAAYVGMFFAALTGKTSFTKAVAVQEDYAASLGETADNAKEAKKYLSGLDEIRTYSEDKDSSSGGYQSPTPQEMFETVPIESKIKEFADKVKQTLSEMFAPLKEAWDKYGAPIVDKLKQIKDRFVEFGVQIATSTAEWFKNLNWEPLLQSVDKLLEKLQPLLDLILDGLAWAWENVLLPFGKWTLEEALPAVIDLFSAALGVLVEVLETLKPLGEWLWDNFLQPIAQWVGDAFVAGLELITDVLNKLSDCIAKWRESGGMDNIIASLDSAKEWIVDIFTRIHNGYEKYMKPVLEKIGQKFQEVMDGPAGETLEKIRELVDKLSEAFQLWWNNVLDPLFKWIADNIMPTLAPIVEFLGETVITAIETVIEVIGGVVDVLSGILDFIIGIFTGDWDRAWNGIKEIFTGNFDAIVAVLKGAWDNIVKTTTYVWNNIKTSLSTVWNAIKSNVTNVFNGIKSFISNIWNGIVNTIKGSINSIIAFINRMISGITSGINSIINALNSLHFDIPSWIPEFGGKSFGFNIPTISAPQIPYLATGAVIPPNAPFMAVLGDQKSGNNIEAPESLLRKIVREEAGGNSGNNTYRFQANINRRTLFDEIITEAKLRQTTNGRNPFELA
ncbi:MAG: hypothetical protein J1E64_04850 [Acetatifactor sp.]|nr:hypothetical protein [Acetatifactor sp.]